MSVMTFPQGVQQNIPIRMMPVQLPMQMNFQSPTSTPTSTAPKSIENSKLRNSVNAKPFVPSFLKSEK